MGMNAILNIMKCSYLALKLKFINIKKIPSEDIDILFSSLYFIIGSVYLSINNNRVKWFLLNAKFEMLLVISKTDMIHECFKFP